MELPVLQNFFFNDAPFWPLNLANLAAWWDTTRGVLADGAAHFTAASSQYLYAASSSNFNLSTGDFSFAGSFYRDSTGNQVLCSKYQDANNYYKLELDAANKLHFIAVKGGVTLIEVQGTTAVTTTGSWYGYYLVVDRDSVANTKIYLNATNDTSGTPTVSATDADNTGSYNVGRLGDGTLYFNGGIDNHHRWNEARSAAQVTAFYNAGAFQTYESLTDTTNLVYWHRLNEEIGTRYDAHGTNDLTASNTTLVSPSVNNGGFETLGAGGSDVFETWVETMSGSSTVTADASSYEGSYACMLTGDGSNSLTSINLLNIFRVGDMYTYEFYYKGSVGASINANDGVNSLRTVTLGADYALDSKTFTAAGTNFEIKRWSLTSSSANIDNVTITDLGPVGIAGVTSGNAANGDAISTLTDYSPSGRNATQSIYSKRPTYVTGLLNNKPMALFDSVDDLPAFSLTDLGTAHTFFIVVKPVALTGVLIGGVVGSYAFYLNATSVVYSVAGTIVSVAHGMSVDTAYVLSVIRSGTTVKFYKNGTQIGTDQTLGANSALAVSALGGNSTGANPYSGYMAEPFFYSSALSAADHARGIAYLRSRYGI